MKHPRLYVPLDVGFARDPRLRRAGTKGELLFIRALAYVKSAEMDGMVPEYDLAAIAVGIPDVEVGVAGLVREKAWEQVEGGWRIVAWHRWNEPQEAIDRRRTLARERQALHRARSVTRDTDRDVTRDVTRESHESNAPQEEVEVEVEVEVEEEEKEKNKSEVAEPATSRALALVERLDIERVCEHLADWIERNGSKRPAITKSWRNDARLLLDVDGRNEEQVHAAIDWCQRHDFWRVHVMSVGKLRAKYDELRLDAQRRRGPTAATHDEKVQGWLGLNTEAAG